MRDRDPIEQRTLVVTCAVASVLFFSFSSCDLLLCLAVILLKVQCVLLLKDSQSRCSRLAAAVAGAFVVRIIENHRNDCFPLNFFSV